MRKFALVLAALSVSAATVESGLWSLRPLVRPAEPTVRDPRWVRNSIDRFVLAQIESAGLRPSPEADRATLLRRVSLDLIGLPPTPEQLDDFLRDQSPNALARAVDRLLASPQYGERWARFWLDQARYADSDGYRGDAFRPFAWRWRDWVIQALNRDIPFDQFTMEQIAGDLLPGSTIDQRIATGFHRNTLTNREGGIDPEQFRVEAIIDRTNTLGTVWLGLTVGCAQCHDHKYDPVTQRDYYRLFAFFNTSEEWTIAAPAPGEIGPHMAARPQYDRTRRELLARHNVAPLQAAWERRMIEAASSPGTWLEWDHAFDDLRTSLSDGEKILRTPAERREAWQRKLLTDYFVSNYHRVIPKERDEELGFKALRKELAKLDSSLPTLSAAMVVREEQPRRKTRLLQRGDYRSPGEAVDPGTPAVLHPFSGETRLDLARWIVAPENPLTARVIVNRMWQQFFGRGIVKTSENFGSQGETPSHPELLDWLASEFMSGGWRMKRLHKLIVTSATYGQASLNRTELQSRDPENRLLARQGRLRLNAESIRDSALAVSGLLDGRIGGPSDEGGYRRGLYMRLFRNKPHAFLANFDAPNGYSPVCRRAVSTTPLQALNLLNDPLFAETARALALRVMREGGDFAARVHRAYLLAFARRPTGEEVEDLKHYFAKQKTLLASRPAAAEGIVPAALSSDSESAAWTGLASVLLNTEEFITRE